jgi:outer membrane protein assembly factor BamB
MNYARVGGWLLVGSVFGSSTLQAEDWPQWRGPHFNGSSTETAAPERFSPTNNIAWSHALPGPGAATPVIWGERVFVSSTDRSSQTVRAMCFDRRQGTLLWNHKMGETMQRDDRSSFASPSPAADAQRVIFFYGSGQLAALDHAGKELWSRSITKDYGEFAFQWTFSTSPLLYQDTLYLQVLQRDVPVNGRGRKDGPNESYLLALDPATGKEKWRHVRPSQAAAESLEAFSTPIPWEHAGRKEILISGGDCLTGHDAATGQELWRWGTWNPNRIGHWRLVPSPVAGQGVILACAPKGSPVYAVKAGLNGSHDESALAWKSEQNRQITSDVPTPLFYQGDFFILSDVRKNLSRVDPATGIPKWTQELPGRAKYEASPTGVAGRIYLMNFAGEVVVLQADTGALLHRVAMGVDGDDLTRSSIAVSQGKLFIRTNAKLFCVGTEAKPAAR